MKTLNDISLSIQQGRLKPALEAMSKLVQEKLSDQTDLRNAVISLLARYNQLQARHLQGVIRDGEAQLSENQIRFAALEMIEILREELNGREAPATSAAPTEQQRIRILFFAANPLGPAQLNLGREVREIEGALARARLRDRFELIQAHATRPKDFLRRILEEKPEFVHFSGHGTDEGLYMLDDEDQPVLLPTKTLADVFKLFSQVVGCVLLNACFSATQARQIREYVPHVIGTSQKLEDTHAIEFAALFYTAIGEGQDIAFAFEFARLGLDLEGGEGEVFVLR